MKAHVPMNLALIKIYPVIVSSTKKWDNSKRLQFKVNGCT